MGLGQGIIIGEIFLLLVAQLMDTHEIAYYFSFVIFCSCKLNAVSYLCGTLICTIRDIRLFKPGTFPLESAYRYL